MSDPAIELDKAIEAERAALLAADYGRLPDLAKRRDTALAELMEIGEPDILRRAAMRVRRNNALVEAALSGLRDAAGRLRTRREVAEAFTTYDRAGASSRVGGAAGRMERKV